MESLVNNNMVSTNAGLPEERGWEYKQISVTRVQGYGFGIAVSGGRDNPHFASGDPSIAVSDVLASGPAERMLQVNDRIISVNGISLQNVEYATAVQVLRDSGDTVVLVVKRRSGSSGGGGGAGALGPPSGVNAHHQHHHHHHGHQLSALSAGSGGGGGGGGGSGVLGGYVGGPPLAALGVNPGTGRVTLVKNSKKEDFGIVLGCKLFIKEISSKARDQLLQSNQNLQEGDIIAKLNNTNCNDVMSLKEAKKIIDGAKDKLHLTVARESNAMASNYSHQTQSSVSTTGAVNNFYKGDDFLTSTVTQNSYSNQNLYVQPPTRTPNQGNLNNGFLSTNESDNKRLSDSSLLDDKSNLAPRVGGGGGAGGAGGGPSGGGGSAGRSRGPLSEANLNQLDGRVVVGGGGGIYGRKGELMLEEPPRPPPPRAEDYYSSRRQLYEDDPIIQKTKQPIPDARYITFHKEGSVGIRLTGGNYVGIFVTAVQPGSPASLQGLQPGDKILKVNDMDMTGVTREEAVLYLLSLQDRIELIVQFCRDEYENIVASQKGDSFYIKTHFHYETPAKGEMSFRSGDIFHVIDTLYNGVVGCWQVFRIGRNNLEVQKGIIPNKARAEELATAQFNATKKEMSANESRGSFFRRRRSNNRRSKSLGKEHWDDILFSDTVSKFPAYERVILKHPGFTRPVILFGPISDVSRDKLLKDFPDKFISPQLDSNIDDTKSKVGSNIIKLSAIRDVISTGKHALLDITPNAVERLNYAQLYPIVIFFKADTKIVIKQLRQGLPKSAHKSSKKLLEQCQKLDKVWSHIFCSNITLNDNSDNWYRKVREIIDKQQTGPLWMSESKPEECLSDDFLFPMSSLRLSYASSPESDLEHSPGPSGNNTTSAGGGGGGGGAHAQGGSSGAPGRLTKASSDPSVVMAGSDAGGAGGGVVGADVLPPYQPTYDTRYGFNPNNPASGVSNSSLQPGSEPQTPTTPTSKDSAYLSPGSNTINNSSDPSLYGSKAPPAYSLNGVLSYEKSDYVKTDPRNEFTGDFNGKTGHKRQSSNVMQHGGFNNHMKGLSLSDHPKDIIYGTAPDLPPRIDRAVKPMGMTTTPTKSSNGRSAHERLFGSKASSNMENNNESPSLSNDPNFNNKLSSLDRNQNSKSDSLSSYDSFNNPTSKHNSSRIIPNAHDDLKTTLSKIDPNSGLPNSTHSTPSKYQRWDPPQQSMHQANQTPNHNRHDRLNSKLDLKYSISAALPPNLDLSNISHLDASPRNSRELDKDMGSMEGLHGSGRDRDGRGGDMYRYSRSPGKQQGQGQQQGAGGGHVETRTDYGKYSRNNTSNPAQLGDYTPTRSSHQDLSQAHLSIHSPTSASAHHHQHNHSTSSAAAAAAQMLKLSTPPNHHHQQLQHHNGYGGMDNGGQMMVGGGGGGQVGYKPVPPPKPKNYKPPYRSGTGNGNGQGQGGNSFGASDGVMQPPLPYQHNKSHSNPVDQRTAAHMHLNPNGHNYYYNMPQGQGQMQTNGPWHTEQAIRYNTNIPPTLNPPTNHHLPPTSPYDLPPPSYDPTTPTSPTSSSNNAAAISRRHTSISYASRSEIAPISASQQQLQQQQQQMQLHQLEYDGDMIDARLQQQQQQGGANSIVDLQGSREQRGSAFELYRKPLHHNMRLVQADLGHTPPPPPPPTTSAVSSLYGSQPNLTNNIYAHKPQIPSNPSTNKSPASSSTRKPIAKAQSFKHQKSTTEGLSTPKFLRRMFGKNRQSKQQQQQQQQQEQKQDLNRNSYLQASERDVTSAIVGEEGATLVNHYWGVSLEIPEGAVAVGRRQEVYFVITDPRLCENSGPPLDLDNGERMLSPLVMCGPQGLEFKKPVILNIPHYANTLPSLGISLKATDSESDICTDWDNILLPSNHAANSVAVKVDHF